MVRVTEELVRKRSEHNEGEISTLEELSLHQEDIEKIEHIHNWCKHLRILYLQSNLISKIENLSKLKKLEYLNLALNNIELIENLQGCESLQKLDLTLNFIGELSSAASLKQNIHLKTLYLTGNPCTDYDGYREYVVVLLPQLESLDGKDIERSERIRAGQVYPEIQETVHIEEENYKVKRRKQKEKSRLTIQELPQLEDEEKLKQFWSQKCDHSPETRVMLSSQVKREQKVHTPQSDFASPPPRTYKLFSKDGRPLNVNQAKIPFHLKDNPENNSFVLDVSVFKHMDSSLIDVDVQPFYVKLTIKGKVLQLILPEEVSISESTAQRSQTTGHLVLTMPKVGGEKRSATTKIVNKSETHSSYGYYSKREELGIGPPDKPRSRMIEVLGKSEAGSAITVCESDIDYSEIPPLEDCS